MVDIRVTGLVKSFDLEKRILDGLSLSLIHISEPTRP